MRDWLNSILGEDGGRVAQFALALIVIIVLILLLAWVAKQFLPSNQLPGANGGKSRKRLGVVAASEVDARRRLVLVRRDEVEHLIMIGGPNDLLIESRILRAGQPAARPTSQQGPTSAPQPERTVPPPLSADLSDPLPLTPPTAGSAANTLPPNVAKPAGTTTRASFDDDERTAPPMVAVQSVQPTVARPAAQPTISNASAATTSPEIRRPSLNDLLSAATAAKAANPQDLPQPVMAAPPIPRVKPMHQDLEEDNRESPTQIVTPKSILRPPVQPSATPTSVIEPVFDREAEVANQIERALSDLNAPTPDSNLAPETKVEAPVSKPTRRPLTAAPIAPQPAIVEEPASSTTSTIRRNREIASPSLPAVPPRPIPPARVISSERSEIPHVDPKPDDNEHSPVIEVRDTPLQELTTTLEAEEANAARKVPVGVSRPAAEPVVEPVGVVQATIQKNSHVDELEEEMAKLLNELGGTSSR